MTRNKPLDAMTQIVAILAPLSSEERVRTVRAAMVLLGETNKDSHIEGGLEQQDAGLGDLPLRARTWMKQYGISTADLDQVFQRTADAMAVIGSVPGSNKKEQTYNAYLLTGIGQLLLAGEPSFADRSARALCESTGCYDINNHSSYLKDRGNIFVGTKERGWVLTAPGLRRGAEIIKAMQTAP